MLVSELREKLNGVPGHYQVIVNAIQPQIDARDAFTKQCDTYELYETNCHTDDDSETLDINAVAGFQ